MCKYVYQCATCCCNISLASMVGARIESHATHALNNLTFTCLATYFHATLLYFSNFWLLLCFHCCRHIIRAPTFSYLCTCVCVHLYLLVCARKDSCEWINALKCCNSCTQTHTHMHTHVYVYVDGHPWLLLTNGDFRLVEYLVCAKLNFYVPAPL